MRAAKVVHLLSSRGPAGTPSLDATCTAKTYKVAWCTLLCVMALAGTWQDLEHLGKGLGLHGHHVLWLADQLAAHHAITCLLPPSIAV
jgi:hypothetical protein